MNIRFKICLLVVSGMVAASSSDILSSCPLCLHGRCYEKTELKDSYALPQILNFAVDRIGNILYYRTIYYTNQALNVYSMNLEDNTVKVVRENNGNERSLAIDQKTRDLYIGADTYIIKYNPVTNKTERIHSDVTVKKLRFKDKLYVLGYTDVTRIYTLEKTGLVMIEPIQENFIVDFVVDKRGDIYYSERVIKNFKFSAVNLNITKILDDMKVLYATDENDELYYIGSVDKSIWKLDYSVDQFVQVGAFDLTQFYNVPTAVDFDRHGNVFYVEYDVNVERGPQKLYYFTASSHHCMK